jgi:hypothetical protein
MDPVGRLLVYGDRNNLQDVRSQASKTATKDDLFAAIAL